MTAVLLAYLQGGWGSVAAAYVVTVGVLVAYVAWVIVRGRRVTEQLPPDERRWM